MVLNFSDCSQFGIHSPAARYTMVFWYLLVLCTSLIGDTTILIATTKNVFRLHEATVMVIKHLAVCDLIMATFFVFPCIVSLVADGWVLGAPICYVSAHFCYYGITIGCSLVATMTTSKYILLQFPLRGGVWLREHILKVCVGLWVFCFYTPISLLAIGPTDISFDYRTYNCMYGFHSPIWTLAKPFYAVLGGALPNLIIVVTTVLMLRTARKAARESLKWKGVITVFLTVVVYMLAYAPFTLFHIMEPLLKTNPDDPSNFDRYFFRVAWPFVSLNITSNFFIYSLTVDSFKVFLKRMVLGKGSSRSFSVTSQGRKTFNFTH